MKKKLAIVGIFYDGYVDIWEDFLELFYRNWPDCPYSLYIVDGVKELNFENDYPVSVIHAGESAEYSRKVQCALNQIDADYFLLLLEDFFLEKKIEVDPIKDTLEIMSNNDVRYLRMPMPEFLVGANTKKYKRDSTGFYHIPQKNEYTVTCQPSIWERGFLKECIGTGNYNAWIFEGVYSYSKKAHSTEFLEQCRIDFSNPIGLRHGAVQGKILPNVYRDITNLGYNFRNKREVLSDAQYKKHLRKQVLKGRIPQFAQRFIKKIYKSSSVVDRYKDDILEQIKELGIE